MRVHTIPEERKHCRAYVRRKAMVINMKNRVSRRILCLLTAITLFLSSLAGVFPEMLSLPIAAKAPNYTAGVIESATDTDVSICGGTTGAKQMQKSEVAAMQFVLTADALSVSTSVPSYSNDTGSVTMALFAFHTDYDTTLLSSPIAEHTFVNFKDNASLTFQFSKSDPLPAGEYILLLYDMYDDTPGESSDAGIGVWLKTPHEGQRAYLNGAYVGDCTFPIGVDYVDTPATLYGVPTKPVALGNIDHAPHMGAVMDFRDKNNMSLLGGSNQTTASHQSDNGETFLRLSAAKDANDPYQYMNLPEATVKCSEYKYVLMKIRRSSGSALASQLFYQTSEVSIGEASSVRPAYQDTTDWQYVIANFGATSVYDGLLTGLRLDYFQSCEGEQWLDIQYIAFFKSEEAALAFHDNFEDFKEPETSDDPSDQPVETTPDYSTYISSDPAGETVPGKLTENGNLAYLYKEYAYSMDFSKTPEEYMFEGFFAFQGMENALVHEGSLHCKAFSNYTFYTKQIMGDKYGLRGGSLLMDLVLESGTVAFTVRQIEPNDAFKYSGLCLELDPNGELTVTDRDGFSDSISTGIDFTKSHRVGVTDTSDTIALSVDGQAVYTLYWDNLNQIIRTSGGKEHKSIHLPGAGYASVSSNRTRGSIDNVIYTYTDIVPKTVTGSHAVDYSTWFAVDDLDRVTPSDVGEPNGKQVGLFYFLNHSESFSGREVNDVTRYYLEGGSALVSNKLSSFAGRDGAYWAEPYFGYYSSNDEWVYRKHAYMLEAAGVDFIFLDVSNVKYFVEQATILFDTWKAIRDEGGETPEIAFMYGDMPFTLLKGLYTLLGPIYENPEYQDLLYRYNGKPLLLGNNDTPTGDSWTVADTTPQTPAQYMAQVRADKALMDFYRNDYQNVLSKFTVRKCWAWQAGAYSGYWDWLQESPQALGTDFDGKVEQITVSLGVHAHTDRGRSYLNGDNTYNKDGNFGFTLGTAKYGYYFEEQFEYALKQDINVLMITGWNEWYAGVQKTDNMEQTTGQTSTPGYYMVDQMSPEYSRDGEPMKLRDGVGFGDNYYYQMVSYIRRFKGMKAAPATINGGNLAGKTDASEWDKVAPAFNDVVGDNNLRHDLSFSAEFLYVNGSARNDLDTAKISQDAESIYFHVTTASPLITVDDELWMNLYIDADQNSATGWEGFDYIINRSRTDKTVSIEKFVDGKWEFASGGEADYTIGESSMVISVRKSLLGHTGDGVMSCNFKWADNANVEGDIMRFMSEGDAAPNDRFVFAYTASTVSDERDAETEAETNHKTETESDVDAEIGTGTESTIETEDTASGCGSSGCGSITYLPTVFIMLGAAWFCVKKQDE